MDDDQTLIARVRAGRTEAFRPLVERYQSLVWTFGRNLLGQSADADDLTQEVFLVAFRQLARYDPQRAAVGTWLLMIARSRGLNRLQQRSLSDSARDNEPIDPGPRPDDALRDRDLWERLDQALDDLPVDQRTAFVLAEIQELPHREIAVIEGVEVGTVKSRVSRAKTRLREVLQDWSAEFPTVLAERKSP
jgi:RNA polymerase sigma-70 factor (ECF subfamily)